MTGSLFSFVSNDALMKNLFQVISIEQGIFLRGLVPLLLAIACLRKSLFVRIDRRNWRLVLMRAFSELGATMAFFDRFIQNATRQCYRNPPVFAANRDNVCCYLFWRTSWQAASQCNCNWVCWRADHHETGRGGLQSILGPCVNCRWVYHAS